MTGRLIFILLAALVVCALALVASQHTARKLYVELQREEATAKKIEVEWGQLQLEQGTWATHGRIERIAIRDLNMRLPAASRIEVVPAPRTEAKP